MNENDWIPPCAVTFFKPGFAPEVHFIISPGI